MATVVSRGETIAVELMSEHALDADLPEAERRVTGDNMTSGVCGCYNGACPEVVAVTHEEVTVNLGLAGALTIAESGSVVMSGPDSIGQMFHVYFADANGDPVTGSTFEFTIRLVDDVDYLARPTSVPPTVPGWAEAKMQTDPDTGICEVYVENTGSPHAWLLVATVGGAVAVSDEFTFGVP